MFGSLGPLEIMIIFVIVLVVFGADRLPELARGLGKGIREFKRAADDVKREIMIDPDLNLDLDFNEPLPKETKSAHDDPYKQDDWENEDTEAVKQPVDSKNESGNVEDQISDTLNIESDSEEEKDQQGNKTNDSKDNDFSEENSEKQNLAG